VPLPGLLAVPLAEHLGHGCAALVVRYMSDLSRMSPCMLPMAMLNVPPVPLTRFSTQKEEAEFEIGTGGPKLQPWDVQSGMLLLTAGGADVGPSEQLGPAQLNVNRLVEPPATSPSGIVAPPPPMFRPPQVRLLMAVEF